MVDVDLHTMDQDSQIRARDARQSISNIDLHAPGTVTLTDRNDSDRVNLLPVPTSDPDDPLNWSSFRKVLNYSLVLFYVLWTFVQLDIGFTAWGPMMDELNMTVDILNDSAALNYAGLAIGCLFFIPFVYKYGRRPVYIFSVAIQFASCIWQARVETNADILISNILSGLGGAISETIVQMTIVDVFFVHQHATMNGWYLAFTMTGAFLGPVASGYIVISQGWRWMWWWCVIFLGLTLVAVIFCFEESKYVAAITASSSPSELVTTSRVSGGDQDPKTEGSIDVDERHILEQSPSVAAPIYTRKTYRQRLALFNKTEGSLWRHFGRPVVVLFRFPAVTYCALTYGVLLALFAIMTSVQATYMLLPPYNFSAVGIGLMNLPPFIGACLGFPYGGWLNDRSILWSAKRNGGVYEPEMRLWLSLPCALIVPAGMLIFGLGLAHGLHWIVLAVGYAIFGFGFIAASDICLSYCTDCYQDIVGDALVGVVFCRNVFSVVTLFLVTPWINGMGIQGLHILVSCIAFGVLLAPLIFIKWGKKFRISTRDKYRAYAKMQPSHRMT